MEFGKYRERDDIFYIINLIIFIAYVDSSFDKGF